MGVVTGPVMVYQIDRVVIRECLQLVILDVRQHGARQLDSAKRRVPDAAVFVDATDLVIKKRKIKCVIVSDQDRIAKE